MELLIIITQDLVRPVQKIFMMDESAVNESNVKVVVRVRPMNRRGECEPQPLSLCLMFRDCVFDSDLDLWPFFVYDPHL